MIYGIITVNSIAQVFPVVQQIALRIQTQNYTVVCQ